jgi:tetratricopeptide (TPR) repeat protein
MASFFEDPEFKSSLARYESMMNDHTPAYLEADELTDIAEYYASTGRDEEADKVIRFGLSIHPDDIDLLIFQSRSLAIKGNTEEARRVMSLITDQSDREVKFLLFDILLEENREQEANRVMNDLAADEEYSMEVMVDIMQAYVDADMLLEADDWYERIDKAYNVAELVRTNKRCRSIFCDYYLTVRDTAHCIPILQEMLDEAPYNIGLWNDLARCYISDEELEKAHEAIDFSLAIDDNDPDALMLKAACFRMNGNVKDCIRMMERAVRTEKRFPQANLQLVKAYLDIRDYTQAARETQALDQRRPELNQGLKGLLDCALAICYTADNESDKAAPLFESLRRDFGNQPDTHLALGHCALLRDEKDQARDEFRQAIFWTDCDEDRFQILFDAAGLLFDFEDLEGASEVYAKMIQQFPEESLTGLYLAMYCFAVQRNVNLFYHCVARIRKEMPDLYEEFGHVPGINNPNFDDLLIHVKQAIARGDIDIDKYLNIPFDE